MADTFSPSLYTRAPSISVASGISLAEALVNACPESAPANVRKACKKLEAAAVTAAKILLAERRQKGSVDEDDDDSFTLDHEADLSWGALRARLLAYSMLPSARYPRAKHAAEIMIQLFGSEGLAFLKEDYATQNATMATILQYIDERGLQKEIDALAGPEFLEQIRDVQARYSAMVAERTAREGELWKSMNEHVRKIQAAIVEYATKVAATVDEDEPQTIEVARRALRAIEAHREGSRRSALSLPPSRLR